jgi:hypothetical protein
MSQGKAGSTPANARPNRNAAQALRSLVKSHRKFELLTTFAALFDLFIEPGRTSARKPVQPQLIGACTAAIFAAVHMTEPGGIAAGLRAAFPGNDPDRMRFRAPSAVCQCKHVSTYQACGPVVALSWPAVEIFCLMPVHPDHAFCQYGLQ